MSSKSQYSDEFKEQIIKKCQETGNAATQARRYNISTNTIHTWIKEYRQTGSVKTLPKAEIVRTDNRPQFMSVKFSKTCQELKLIHERIPVKTPNMNAHIEAFHSILEEERYICNEFTNFR
ncbi:Transposase [Thermosyntropha lipolytica DSM 11003]|uniref:Transposase n=1 Tax=Thermosyntropha lipolytica DSM 11003 TaxID=1123382 RepID=A0A1M5S4X8_9FIRM|nr:transposase [Thermosyntropha lipolytica]SHH33490.1 Transposase [Thermosyntropha lipolytica DSM 11003]